MSPSKRLWRELWALPAVLAICALMVVPASALLQSPAAARGGPAIGLTAVPTSHGTPSVPASAGHATEAPSAGVPSAAATASSALARSAKELQTSGGNPSTAVMLQDVASAIQSGAVSPLTARLPSNLLSMAGATDPTDALTNQGPMSVGLSDLGLNNSSKTNEISRYLLNETAVRGNVTLSSYNATAGSLYEASSPLFENNTTANSPGSPYDSAIQLNTVLANVTYPCCGANFVHHGAIEYSVGTFWTQNVLLFLGNHLQLLDNIWNMSATTAPTSTLNQGTLWSYYGVNGYKGVLLPEFLGGFYYDYGPKIPLSYPLSIQLTNNVTVNATTGRDMVLFQYSVKEGAKTYAGTYDTVIFNSPTNSTKPYKNYYGAGAPVFRIDGLTGGVTPGGGFYDSELVFCGPGAGSNAVINEASGTLSMAYSNATVPTWHAPPSAYDYGVDTGESAIGLAATWATNHTVSVTQGPSLLYGLWGTTTASTPSGVDGTTFALPAEQAAPGSFEFSSTSSPNYAFTFIGWGTSATPTWASIVEPAYAPSNAAGIVTTFLPPSLPGTTGPAVSTVVNYGVEGFADGYQALNSTIAFGKAAQTSYKVTLTAKSSSCKPCFTNPAPIYINGPAQASAVVTALGVSSAKVPTLKNLYLSLDPTAETFNLQNDLFYPTFSLVSITNLTTTLVVYNVVQGSNNGGPDIVYTFPSGRGYLSDGIVLNATLAEKPNQQYVDYGGTGDVFSNLTLVCWERTPICVGGALSLWDTTGVTVLNVSAYDGSGGVWSSTTSGTSVKNATGYDEATAFTVLDSTGAVGFNISGVDDGVGINDTGSTGASITYLNSSYSGAGLEGFWDNGTTVKDVRANHDSTGIDTYGGIGLTVTNLWVNKSAGIDSYLINKTTVTNATGWNDSRVINLFNGSVLSITNQKLNRSRGDYLTDNFATATITDTVATNGSTAAVIDEATGVTFSTLSANGSWGVFVNDTIKADVSVTDLSATLFSIGAYVYYSTGITVATVTVRNESTGVYIYGQSADVSVSGVTVTYYSVGVNVSGDGPYYEASDVTVSGVTATAVSDAVFVQWATATTISSVTVSNQTVGVYVFGSIATTISGVTATNKTLGTLFEPWYLGLYGPYAAIDSFENAELKASDITTSYYPAALFDYDSSGMQVSSVTVSHGQYALLLNDTYNSFFTGINAPNDWQGISLTEDAYENTISNSQFTNDTSYGVAMYYGADYNVVYGNQFVDDNGATGTYNAGHIQASAGDNNYFYICTNSPCTTGLGNYWSDWHAQNANGSLQPYVVAGGAVDEFPTSMATTPSSTGSAYAVVAIAMGLIAVFVAVTAVLALRYRKGGKAATQPPVAWTSPSGGTGGTGGTGGSAGPGGNTWSEGAGGKPPAS